MAVGKARSPAPERPADPGEASSDEGDYRYGRLAAVVGTGGASREPLASITPAPAVSSAVRQRLAEAHDVTQPVYICPAECLEVDDERVSGRLARWLLPGLAFLVPLACSPNLGDSFELPKLVQWKASLALALLTGTLGIRIAWPSSWSSVCR
jgi:hypothetical protein